MDYRTRIATTAEEIKDTFALRYQVFCEEQGKFLENARDGLLYDEFDAFFEDTYLLNAYVEDELVGTVRLTQETECKLPIDAYFNFDSYRDLTDRTEEYQNAKFGSASAFAIRKDHRKNPHLFSLLMYLMSLKCYENKVSHILVAPEFSTRRIYYKLGFVAYTSKTYVEKYGGYVLPMIAYTPNFYKKTLGWYNNEYICCS